MLSELLLSQLRDFVMICFVYGTLMAPEVFSRVVCGEKQLRGLEYQDATLPGYARYKLQARDYPGIVQCPQKSTHGRIVKGVNAEQLERLDYFEGAEYDRATVFVKTSEGTVEAQAYVWKDKDLIVEKEWSFHDFKQKNLDKWVADELEDAEGMGGRFWRAE